MFVSLIICTYVHVIYFMKNYCYVLYQTVSITISSQYEKNLGNWCHYWRVGKSEQWNFLLVYMLLSECFRCGLHNYLLLERWKNS